MISLAYILGGLASVTMPVMFLDGLFSDMTIVLKIFVIMSIASYVIQHLGKGPLAIMAIAVISYLVIFDYFYIFGGIYILYMLALLGGVQLMMDFFIVGPQMLGGGGAPHGEMPEEMNGLEFKERQKHLMHMRRGAGF